MLGPSQTLENIGRAEMTKLVRQTYSRQLRLPDIQRKLATNQPPSIHVANKAVQHYLAAGVHGKGADRNLASTFQRREKCALTSDVYHRLLIAQRARIARVPESSVRIWIAIAPCRPPADHAGASRYAVICCDTPSRCNPAAARMAACTCP